ncbi:ureidoacrylate peracid hydrolase [Alloyangia pacifica]|uniref:Ureidoacrylate peracid hydrolase n=2 Tax=Alloyangia pacifica TaxID=311180 RepID=A0A1I6RJ90_9RHOB|nr:ureidoacrylate peracid hydrolase [Alloyangia pacifica]SFS64706.1 ureidoacrylate peracid hydrolase [Alloyangia pacifica]
MEVAAQPEAFGFDPETTALIVVDMQNAYATKGGYVDLAGFDVSGARSCIENISKVTKACRDAGVLVTFLQNGWDPAYVEAGGPESPNVKKSNAIKTMKKRPELWGQLLAKGGWDYDIIDELKPREGDLLIPKPRYSGFFNSYLDSALRSRGIKTLIFTGIATNVCVESSLRDAFHLEYHCLMLEDATNHLGPDFIQQASVYNVATFFGWVAKTEDFCAALISKEEKELSNA